MLEEGGNIYFMLGFRVLQDDLSKMRICQLYLFCNAIVTSPWMVQYTTPTATRKSAFPSLGARSSKKDDAVSSAVVKLMLTSIGLPIKGGRGSSLCPAYVVIPLPLPSFRGTLKNWRNGAPFFPRLTIPQRTTLQNKPTYPRRIIGHRVHNSTG